MMRNRQRKTKNQKIIGVLGGVGPYAGLDLVRKIFDETIADTDQEHLPVILMSLPGEIEDRTGFLLGDAEQNPAQSIARILVRLAQAGATVAGIPCNTAHAPQILGPALKELKKKARGLKLLNLIDEGVSYIKEVAPSAQRVGVLSTTGTGKAGIYRTALTRKGFSVIELDDDAQAELVQKAIYDTEYGIKAHSNPVTDVARSKVEEALRKVGKEGVDAIILGCTELPLAIVAARFRGIPLIDPARGLARALVRDVNPLKLRALSKH